MDFSEISLEMKERIEEIRAAANHRTSSHAFVSLYLWRAEKSISIVLENEAFLPYSSDGLYFPCGSEKGKLSLINELLAKEGEGLSFGFATDEDVEFCRYHFGERVTAEEKRELWEYVYTKKEQIEMVGKSFTYQRAKVNKARRLGEISSVKITEELIPTAKEITLMWEKASPEHRNSDISPTLEALDNFSRLSLFGNMLFIDENPCGFNLCSMIADDTADIHIAKTLVNDIDTLMKLELYKTLPDNVVYINREEDLGIRGLRIHKSDAQPSSFNKIYTIKF